MKTALREERKKEYVRMYEGGYDVYQISGRFQCDSGTVRRALKEEGVYQPRKHSSKIIKGSLI